jgi:hypothetical protein
MAAAPHLQCDGDEWVHIAQGPKGGENDPHAQAAAYRMRADDGVRDKAAARSEASPQNVQDVSRCGTSGLYRIEAHLSV